MDSSLKKILDIFESLKGQHVITIDHKVERLIAIGSSDIDYYWITYDGRKFNWHTCVGKLIPLRGYIPDNDYNTFIWRAKHNHLDQVIGDNEKKDALCYVHGNDEIVSDFCWDLN